MEKLQIEWSLRQLSLVTGIDRHEIKKRLLGLDAVPGKRGDPVYKAPECFRALIKGSVKPRGGAAERKAIAEANRAERKDLLEAGSIIPADKAGQVWEDLTMMFRQRALNVGNNLESQGKINHEQRIALDAEIKSALSELSKAIDYKAGEIEKEEK